MSFNWLILAAASLLGVLIIAYHVSPSHHWIRRVTVTVVCSFSMFGILTAVFGMLFVTFDPSQSGFSRNMLVMLLSIAGFSWSAPRLVDNLNRALDELPDDR